MLGLSPPHITHHKTTILKWNTVAMAKNNNKPNNQSTVEFSVTGWIGQLPINTVTDSVLIWTRCLTSGDHLLLLPVFIALRSSHQSGRLLSGATCFLAMWCLFRTTEWAGAMVTDPSITVWAIWCKRGLIAIMQHIISHHMYIYWMLLSTCS